MTIQIRRGVFETNSSSTHSLTMCSKEDYDKWAKGNLYMIEWPETKFFTKDDLIEYLKNSEYPPSEDLTAMDDDEFEEYINDNGYAKTYDTYFDGDLEEFEDTFTTPSGEIIIAFGKYGYNG